MASTAQDKKTIDFDPFACVRKKKKKTAKEHEML